MPEFDLEIETSSESEHESEANQLEDFDSSVINDLVVVPSLNDGFQLVDGETTTAQNPEEGEISEATTEQNQEPLDASGETYAVQADPLDGVAHGITESASSPSWEKELKLKWMDKEELMDFLARFGNDSEKYKKQEDDAMVTRAGEAGAVTPSTAGSVSEQARQDQIQHNIENSRRVP